MASGLAGTGQLQGSTKCAGGDRLARAESRSTLDAEAPLSCLVILPVLLGRPDEEHYDKHGAEEDEDCFDNDRCVIHLATLVPTRSEG